MTTAAPLPTTSSEQADGMAWRVTISVVTVFGLLIELILWVFFFADEYSTLQNLAALTVSLLVFAGVMGATWASWGMRQGERWRRRGEGE